MRLVVKRNGQTVNEFQFDRGPVYIGRHAHSQVFLSDRAVSRQHAAIFTTQEGKWVVEDLDSANKTFLNDKAIHKAEIKTGDCIRIGDFTIEIDLEAGTDAKKPIHLEDTLMPSSQQSTAALMDPSSEVIVRKSDAERAPDITLPAKRVKDFMEATEAICKANGLDVLVKTLLSLTLKQFRGYHSWCALRNQPDGPMTCHAGKSRDGRGVNLNDLKLSEKITQAIETRQFVLLPRVSASTEDNRILSALIGPVVDPAGCFGVLYVDNSMDHEHFSLSDLDYLMLLAIHTAAIIENF
ncbi:MAG TPA: FHA domain-containing protein [Sedimentisphaerales bacterium]|nr:FHA domain-containing protein [Sedimentisphaerales bacterium]